MFPFSQSVAPAFRSHLDSQAAFYNDLSKSLLGSFQNLCAANMQLSQSLIEETLTAGQGMLTTGNSTDALSAITLRAQPASDKLRAYQQHLARLAAEAQMDQTRITQQHVQETSRTAQVLADEVSRAASEETDRNLRVQEEALKNFRDPFQEEGTQRANGNAQTKPNQQAGGASIQSAAQGGATFPGNEQGKPAQPGQQGSGKQPGKPS